VYIFLGLVLFAFPIHAQTAPQVAKKAFESTVLLVMQDAHGQPLSVGSGFFVQDGIIASNLHVMEGATSGYAKLVGQKTKYDIRGIVAVDSDHDLVLLGISAEGVPALPLVENEKLQVGEPVFAVGNPRGLEGTFSQGIVSSIRGTGSERLLQITAPISPGSSGGPVLNDKGEVVGVSVATFRGGQNLNFAIPAAYLRSLLARKGAAKPLTPEFSAPASRSMVKDLGERSSEGIQGAAFTWDTRSLQMGEYSFSLINKLRTPVRNISCLVIFYDGLRPGTPLDLQKIQFSGVIPGGLAKRVKGRTDSSVEKLNAGNFDYQLGVSRPGRIECRILDFTIIDDSE